MKKIFGITLMVLLISTCLICHVYAATASFKISITIPAVVGLNVPPYDTEGINAQMNEGLRETMTEEIWRDNQRVILKTTVTK